VERTAVRVAVKGCSILFEVVKKMVQMRMVERHWMTTSACCMFGVGLVAVVGEIRKRAVGERDH